MPFIWDDNEWLLIDDDDSYDRSRFVVVHKLHVKLNDSPWQIMFEFTIDQIHRFLRKFGEISSVELLPGGDNEAHVTFASDRSAYLAQLQYEYDRESRKPLPLHIEPADTWKQPTGIVAEHQSEVKNSPANQAATPAEVENEPKIFTLNEDCFLHLFKFLDVDSLVNASEVCQMFHNLIHRYRFPQIHRFEVNNTATVCSMPLRKMRRTLRCIGPYLTELKYQNANCLRQKKFLEILATYIGTNLRRAEFRNSSLCEDNHMFIIAPILRNLEYLEIYDFDYNQHDEIDFEAICPNLIELNLKVNMRLDVCCKPWTRLRHLNIINNERLHTETFIALMAHNPQLISLEFSTFESDLRLQAIAENLTQLQKLTLDSLDWNLAGWHIVHLVGLQHLTEINLQTLDYQHLRGIFDGLATMKQLQRISLHAYRPEEEVQDGEQEYEESMVDVAKELPNLHEFSIKSISITCSKLMDFVQWASELKVLHIHSCLPIDDALIRCLSTGTLAFFRTPPTVGAKLPLQMFVNPSDLLDLSVRRDEKIKEFIELDVRCHHCGF